MGVAPYLARRYLFGKHRIPFIARITHFTIVGLALGVFALVLAFAVMRGFKAVVTEKIIGFDAHLQVERLFPGVTPLSRANLDRIGALPQVELVYPGYKSEILAKTAQATEGVVLYGLPLKALERMESISQHIVQGQLNPGGLVIGQSLAEKLGVGLGQIVYVGVLQLEKGRRFGLPRLQPLPVVAIFNSGLADYDRNFIYLASPTYLKAGLGSRNPAFYGVFLNDISATDMVVDRISSFLPYTYMVNTWQDRHYTLFAWMRTQQIPILVIISLVLVVALINITSSLILITLEKQREIGTLKALGASRRMLLTAFALKGVYLGVIGAVAGSLAAWILGELQQRFGFIRLPSDVYFMDRLPILFQWGDVGMIAGIAVLVALSASIFPAYKAGRVAPAEALRYE